MGLTRKEKDLLEMEQFTPGSSWLFQLLPTGLLGESVPLSLARLHAQPFQLLLLIPYKTQQSLDTEKQAV